ncbi:TPA: hypothetical protein ACH3X1_000955 [Trebouxia sp. C0004]
MPLALMQPNGACINLTQDGRLRLGRQNVAPSFGGAAHVSRVQCEISSVPSGRQACLLLTSKSKHNPTGVQLGIHRADHKRVVKLLNEGESTQLHVGDRILLLANELDQFLEVAKSAEVSSAETAQSPPQKRPRLSSAHDIGSTGNQASTSGELLSMSQASNDAQGAQALTSGIPPEGIHAAVSSADTYSSDDAPGDTLAPSTLSAEQAAADQAAAADVPEAAADPHLSGMTADREVVTQGVATSADLAGSAAAAGAAPVVVILVGVPGSGKSTFCARLIAKGNTTWVRVNQDSISNGRRGSKQQCLAAARNAVLAGHNCIVDRCHQDAQQRSDFIRLAAGLHCEAHAIVLGLPAKVCAGRTAARMDHEGGVQGPSAPRVVHMMHRQLIKAGPPTKAEGLTSIMVCRSDQDVKAAFQAWSAYGQPGSMPADMFKQANPLRQAFASSMSTAVTTVDGSCGRETQHSQGSNGKDGKQLKEAADALSSPPAPAQSQLTTHFPSTSSSAAVQQQVQNVEGQSCSSTTATATQLVLNQLEPHLVQATASDARVQQPAEPQTHTQKAPGRPQNAFSLLMRASKESSMAQGTGHSPPDLVANNVSVPGGSNGPTAAGVGSRPGSGAPAGRSGVQAGWQGALQRIAAHPERHTDQYPEMQIYDDCVVINDAFPKACCHALVIARQEGLNGPADLRSEHLPLLGSMQAAAEQYIHTVQSAADPHGQPGAFKMGFHSIPSMSQLHMHVISQDFSSASLKNKKHWNSFTTEFFIKASHAATQLQSKGCLEIDRGQAERMLKNDLLCHICHKSVKNVPALKTHIQACINSKH